jgi:hypothetical protein
MSEKITPRKLTAEEVGERLGGGVLIIGVPHTRGTSNQPVAPKTLPGSTPTDVPAAGEGAAPPTETRPQKDAKDHAR